METITAPRSIELTARTRPGADLVALADWLADDLASPHESTDALRASGYFAAPVPEALGGLGVSSVHDVIVASSRLARGDAAVAAGVNAHLAVVLGLVRRWSMARAAGNPRREQALAGSLRAIARCDAVMAAALTEPGQDLTRPITSAVRTDAGWRIDGHKICCTMSPAATMLIASVRFLDEDGVDLYGFADIPAGSPGVRIHRDRDTVTFDAVEVPRSALRGGFRAGSLTPFLERNLTSELFDASASLGIAESALASAIERGGSRQLSAEAAVELSVSRAAISRTAGLIDEHYDRWQTQDGPGDAIIALFAEAQAAKVFAEQAARRVVARAQELG
jgi:alkylation response protein AidB-like acyl-CoA dehydrogenase